MTKRCPLPLERSWGVALQLPALRSRRSWGMGDFADLKRFAKLMRERGAAYLQLNPLGAPKGGLPQEPCPYFPSTRRFINPMYLRVEDVPGALSHGADIERLAQTCRTGEDGLIARDAIYKAKRTALELIWSSPRDDADFRTWRAAQGPSLEAFARFSALEDEFGQRFSHWPEGFRRPDYPAVERFAQEHADRVSFHAWLQWLCDQQLGACGVEIGLIRDMTVGFCPDGFDAWEWQDLLAKGVEVGAPPDDFNRDGQNWRLPAFEPDIRVASGESPILLTARALSRHAAGLRIDHVMALSRLFWIPKGAHPSAGQYVRYPEQALFDGLAELCQEEGTFLIGEDLGVVENGFRDKMASRNVLSTKLFWFEESDPKEWPPLSVAALGTHDLPTARGLLSGEDPLSEEHTAWLKDRVGTAGVETLYEALASSAARMAIVSAEDLSGSTHRVNRPGIESSENWQRPLPHWLDDMPGTETFQRICAAMEPRTTQGETR